MWDCEKELRGLQGQFHFPAFSRVLAVVLCDAGLFGSSVTVDMRTIKRSVFFLLLYGCLGARARGDAWVSFPSLYNEVWVHIYAYYLLERKMLVFIYFSIRYVIAAYAIWQKGVIDKCRYLDVIEQIYKFALLLKIGI